MHWEKLADSVDTIIIMMGVGQLRRISTRLLRAGMNKDTDVAIIENGATSKQRLVIGTLENIVVYQKGGNKTPSNNYNWQGSFFERRFLGFKITQVRFDFRFEEQNNCHYYKWSVNQ